MPRTLLLICLIALAPAGVRAESDYIDAAALHDADLVKYWQLRLPLAAGETITDAYLVDDQLYFGSSDGFVFAVHAPTGALRWSTEFTRGGYRLWRPAHWGDVTAIVTPPEVVLFDSHYGTPISRFDLRFPAGAAGVSNDKLLFIGGLDRRLYAFRPRQDFEYWKAGTDSQLVSVPVLRENNLYFASDNGRVYACEAMNKVFVWINRALGSVTADLAVDENGVYVASRNRSLYLLDLANGRTRWRVRLSSQLYEPPVITPDTAYQYSELDGVVAINAAGVNVEDRIRWRMPRGRTVLTVGEQTAYLLTTDGAIVLADAESGAVRKEVPANGMMMPIAAPQQPALFLASADGRVFCAKQRGVPFVPAADVANALALKTEQEQADEAAPPAAEPPVEPGDTLRTRQAGPPIGGKSKVTREYQGGSNAP